MKKILYLILSICIFVPELTWAATVRFDIPQIISKDAETLVRVQVQTGGDKINAISGAVRFDASKFKVVKTLQGNSIVTMWLEKPHTVTGTSLAQSEIVFSGITPGGFQGNFTLFSFVVKPLEVGFFDMKVTDLLAYKNNGEGTPVSISFITKSTQVISDGATSTVVFDDTTKPEVFTPIISSLKDVYNGRYFVSFDTQDKGTGIDHYEYSYTWFSNPGIDSWKVAQSPLEIDSMAQSKQIFIKAIDKAGNERIVEISGPHRYRTFLIWGILILIALCAFLFTKRRSSLLSR